MASKSKTLTAIEINELLCKIHLPWVRIALCFNDLDEQGVERFIKSSAANGTIEELLEGWVVAAEKLELIVQMLDIAMLRLADVLRREGLGPYAPRTQRKKKTSHRLIQAAPAA